MQEYFGAYRIYITEELKNKEKGGIKLQKFY